MMIRPFDQRDMPDVETLSLLAWEPVFHSFEQVLGTEIYLRIYPDWKTAQRTAVKEMCEDVKTETWVTEADGAPAGFIVWELNRQTLEGEVHMLAVHPRAVLMMVAPPDWGGRSHSGRSSRGCRQG